MSARDLEAERRVAMLKKYFRNMDTEMQEFFVRFAALQAQSFPAHRKPLLKLVHSTSNVGAKK